MEAWRLRRAEGVPRERFVARLEALLEDWVQRRRPREGLGDSYEPAGADQGGETC